jgi:N-acetylneuraminic acid mutarotase
MIQDERLVHPMIRRLNAFVVLCGLFSTVPLSAQIQGAWANTGNIPTALEYNIQVRLSNGNVLIAGGWDGTSYYAAAQLYNPGKGTWAATESMAIPRSQFAAVVLPSGKVLVEGGSTGNGAAVSDSAELYDPNTGTWSSAGNMSVARYGHTATLLQDGKVMVTGGCVASNCSSVTGVTEIYDPINNTWTVTHYPLNTARAFQTATLLANGKVLVVGGCTSYCVNGINGLFSSEIFIINTNPSNLSNSTWTNGPSSSVRRYGHSATLLANGKVLVAGGTASYVTYAEADLYDPTVTPLTPNGAFTATGSLTAPKGRYAHTATALPKSTVFPSGIVLLAGGEYIQPCGPGAYCPYPLNTAEIYDVQSGKFSPTGNLQVARASHTATLLAGNDMLVVGGCVVRWCTSGLLTSASEVYTPLTLSISSYSLNFGLAQTGVPSPGQTVKVTNVSDAPVTFTSIAPSGDFLQTKTCPITPQTLAVGATCTINLSFKPMATGTRTGAVTLHDNSLGNPTQTIKLTGIGQPYAITLSPNPLNLGQVVPGPGQQSTATVTVRNNGGAQVSISSMSATPTGVFTVTSSNCPSTLVVQQTCTVTIKFTPPDSVPYTGTLQVFDNALGSPHVAKLTGTGID